MLTLQIMTPFLTAKLAGKYVAVDAAGLLNSTLQVSSASQMLSLFYFVYMLLCHFTLPSLLTGCAFSCIGWCISESIFPTSC